MSLAKKLQELRKKAGESLQDVATSVRASRAHIWELETGRSQNPSIELIRRLADHFRVSVAWLVDEVPYQGSEHEQAAALYRALNELPQPSREIIQTIIDGMRRNQDST